MRKGITLIGMPASGKTTISKELAEALGWPLVDVDHEMARMENLATVGDIIRVKGSAYALELEEAFLNSYDLREKVISPPGSIIYTNNLAKVEAETEIFYLDVPIHTLAERLAEDPENRRGVIGLLESGLHALYEERRPLYLQWAKHRLPVGDMSALEIRDEILKVYNTL
jgi:shikimate kinase